MAVLCGVGKACPEGVVKNNDITAFMETSDEWIQQRSGIAERRWIRRGEEVFQTDGNNALAAIASKNALEQAKVSVDEIEAVFFATISPDTDFPGSGGELLEELGCKSSIPFFEIRNQCSGFLYALALGNSYVDSSTFSKVLVIGSEVLSNGLSLSSEGRGTAVLFGDGGGAAVLRAAEAEEQGIFDITVGADGSYAEKLVIQRPGFAAPVRIQESDYEDLKFYPHMEGKAVFRMASTKMPCLVKEALGRHSLNVEDLDLIVPHQANQRILDALGAVLGCPEKVFSNIAQYGNTTAGTIPLALTEALEQGRIRSGSLVCLVSFGAGFSWGAALLRWPGK